MYCQPWVEDILKNFIYTKHKQVYHFAQTVQYYNCLYSIYIRYYKQSDLFHEQMSYIKCYVIYIRI